MAIVGMGGCLVGGVDLAGLKVTTIKKGQTQLNWTADKDYDALVFVITENGVHYGSIDNIRLNKNGSGVASTYGINAFNKGTDASGAGMQTSVYFGSAVKGDVFTSTDTVYHRNQGCYGIFAIEEE